MFCIVFCLATNALLAGPPDGLAANSGLVGKEIERRQKIVDDAKLNIIEADELALDGNLAEAVEKYFSAYNSTSDAAISKPVHDLARTRLSSISVVYARDLARAANYDEANQLLDRVLAPDVAPDHAPAKKLKTQIADPEHYNPALTPAHVDKLDKVNDLFNLAEGHMKLGDFDVASLTYAAILREDPTNESARRGMEAASDHISDYYDSARDHFRAKALNDINKSWEFQVPLRGDTVAKLSVLPGGGNSDAISDRLRNIILPEVDFTEETLDAVAEYLTRKSKELDPTGVGVNFVVQIPPEDAAIRSASVNLILHSVSLGDVVRFVTESIGAKFYIDQFAVVITSLNSASTALVTKNFYVPPDFLNSAPAADDAGGGGLDDPFGGGGSQPSALSLVRLDAKTYLERAGVTFPEGSSAVHARASNTLIVRNTQANVDLVEALVGNLNKSVPHMVRISLTQVEVTYTDSEELTFDTLLGQFNLPGTSSVFGSGGQTGESASNFPFTPPGSDVPVGVNSLSSGIRSGNTAISSSAIDSVANGLVAGASVAGSSSAKGPSPFAISAPFGDPQFQIALRAISQHKGSTVTNQPSTLTRPGQRALIEVHREFIYPTEYDPPEIPQTFDQGGNNGGIIIDPINQIITVIPGQDAPNTLPVTPAHPSAFDVKNVGTRFEVEPSIDPNGLIITLNMSVEFSQFEGFINYGTPITNGTTVLTDNRILQPLFKVSRLAQPVHVQDGANFVIGGLMNESSQVTKDKVPFLGDVPVVGRLFRGDVSERRRKAILFFVSARIIDPSGQFVNRPAGSEVDR